MMKFTTSYISVFTFCCLSFVNCFERERLTVNRNLYEQDGGDHVPKKDKEGEIGGRDLLLHTELIDIPSTGSSSGMTEMGDNGEAPWPVSSSKASSKGYVPPGKGKGYVPPGKGKGYVPPGKGKGYVPPGKGYVPPGKGYVPPGKGKGYVPPSSSKGYVPPGKGKGYVPPGKGKGYVPPGKGKGYVPPGKGKGFVPPGATCQQIEVAFRFDELEPRLQVTATGRAYDEVPFYDAGTGDILGYYSDAVVDMADGDCVGTGTFSFGPDRKYPSQITINFSCDGNLNTIVGGNGDYGCAKGFEEYVFRDDVATRSELNICSPLCPPVNEALVPLQAV